MNEILYQNSDWIVEEDEPAGIIITHLHDSYCRTNDAFMNILIVCPVCGDVPPKDVKSVHQMLALSKPIVHWNYKEEYEGRDA
jgi:hypothetical protein